MRRSPREVIGCSGCEPPLLGTRVVSLCSLNGVNAHMYTVHYHMAKEALRAITRTAAREWASRGITCNILCPAAETEASKAHRRVATPWAPELPEERPERS